MTSETIMNLVIGPVVLALIAAVGWLGNWTRLEMKECKVDRAALHERLTKAEKDCGDDRALLNEKITELRVDLSRVNVHLESTDAQQVTNTNAIAAGSA